MASVEPDEVTLLATSAHFCCLISRIRNHVTSNVRTQPLASTPSQSTMIEVKTNRLFP